MRPLVRNLLCVFVIAVVFGTWYGMFRDGHSATARCSDIQSSASSVSAQISGATGPMKQAYISQASYLILDHPSCFDASTVALAQTALDRTR